MVLAAALCVGSASAVDVYSIESDTQLMTADDGVATVAADDTWYDSMFDLLYDIELHTQNTKVYTRYSYQYLQELVTFFDRSASSILYDPELDDQETLNITTIYGLLNAIYMKLIGTSDTGVLGLLSDIVSHIVVPGGSSVLMETGQQGTVNSSGYMLFSSMVRRGFLGLSANISDLSTSNSTAIYAAADLVGADIDTATTSVNSSISALSASNVAVVNSAADLLKTQIQTSTTTVKTAVDGARDVLHSDINSMSEQVNYRLDSINGNLDVTREQLSDDLDEMQDVLHTDLDEISDGSYDVLVYDSFDFDPDNELLSLGSVSSMGEMLHMLLTYIQLETGRLSYIYADEDTIQAKKDAAENTSAANAGFLAPDSVGGISADSLGDAADAVGSTKELFDTGVSVGQAFEQLQGSGPLEFFTSTTASNLNTVPATASEDDEDFVHFYDPTNSEFFELIGKGGD